MTPPPLPPAAVAVLACPVCGRELSADTAGLRCATGHAFDRARQGHVTLLPPGGTPHEGDSAEMVADRAEFLAAGHYAGITAALAEATLAGPPVRTVVDLGGGTGAHLAGVLDRAPDAVGVVLDAAVDRVLVVFAPRNGAEAARVLAPGGRLVVVTPAADHLAELVGPLGLLSVDPAKADRLAAGMAGHLEQVDGTAHREVLTLDHAAVRTLVGMGPHARHLGGGALAARVAALPAVVAVTVAVDVTTWSPARTSPARTSPA